MKNTIPKTSILSLKEGRLHNLKLALSDWIYRQDIGYDLSIQVSKELIEYYQLDINIPENTGEVIKLIQYIYKEGL
jgi:hypothetical protein